MNHKTWLLSLVLVVALLLAGCSGEKQLGTVDTTAQPQTEPIQTTVQTEPSQTTAQTEPSQTTAPQKLHAPDFTVYDVEGNAVKLSDFIGKPVMVNFWASWCGPCKREMPDFEEKYRELGEDVQFLVINLTDGIQETVASASDYISQQGYTFPVYYDTSSEAAMLYGIYSIPTTFFIDAEGCAIAQAKGAIDGETLQQGIDMITP